MHSITFVAADGARYNTANDFGLISKNSYCVAPPTAQIDFETVPHGAVLDYTEALTGSVCYGLREGTWEFHTAVRDTHKKIYHRMLSVLHGKRFKIFLEDEEGICYDGRVTVSPWNSEKSGSSVSINYQIEPYSQMGNTGSTDWQWDELFDNVIYYGTFDVSGSKARTLINPSGLTLPVKITCSDAMAVTVNGTVYQLSAGFNDSPFSLPPGDTRADFQGNGRVMVDYEIRGL